MIIINKQKTAAWHNEIIKSSVETTLTWQAYNILINIAGNNIIIDFDIPIKQNNRTCACFLLLDCDASNFEKYSFK